MNENERDKSLQLIIEELCKKDTLKPQVNDIINQLKDIYSDQKYRHKYSMITQTILNTASDKDQGLMLLAQNIKEIIELVNKEKENENIKTQLDKLYDHINLECIRLENYDNKLNSNYNELNSNYNELKDKLNRQQTQYVTILGIFASIVLTFVGGLVFSTSVLENITQTSIFRLVFAVAFIALFFGNILYKLFSFLSEIALGVKEKEKGFFGIKFFNVALVLVIIVSVIGELLWDKCLKNIFFFFA